MVIEVFNQSFVLPPAPPKQYHCNSLLVSHYASHKGYTKRGEKNTQIHDKVIDILNWKNDNDTIVVDAKKFNNLIWTFNQTVGGFCE